MRSPKRRSSACRRACSRSSPSRCHRELGSSPALAVLVMLSTSVAVPFFVLSTLAPALQRWFSATGSKHAADPYFLYAASNTGSLAALAAYPLVIEPAIDLDVQSRV